eukprot:4161742-Karenia_brevis.AAC.1
MQANRRWYHVHGGLTAVIVTLLTIGWSCPSPDKWRDDLGQEVRLTLTPCDTVLVVQTLTAAIRRGLWKKAASHHMGQGLQEGVHLPPLQRTLQHLRKQGRSAEAGTLVTIASAGIWTPERIHQA